MRSRPALERIAWVVFGLLLVGGLARAVALAWATDDAFISLRYAENLLNGHGLVYNAGERVEGYTNLSWTLLLAGLMALGLPDLLAAEGLGILAYLWLALCLLGWSLRRAGGGRRPFLPLAAGLVLVSDDFHEWATGGLETMLFAAIATQALVLTRLDGATPRRSLLVGVLLGLLVLTRPDGLLLAAAAVLSWWIPLDRFDRANRVRHSLATLAPLALVLAVLVPWKLAYYGELLPTAFYSKSVLRPYPSQGFFFVGLYLAKNWFLIAVGFGALVALLAGRNVSSRKTTWDNRFFLGSCALFVAYLVWVGGDFMFARRLVPVMPLCFLAIENRVAAWPAPRPRALAAAVILVAAALPWPIYRDYQMINDIADERSFYPPETLELRRRQAELVARVLEGTEARVAFEGGLCMFGYYSKLPYLVELTGLTNYSLAKLPLEHRGRPGHEKFVSNAWLREHRVHFFLTYAEPPFSRSSEPLRVDEIYFDDLIKGHISFYEDAVMDRLRHRPEVDFVPIGRAVASIRRKMQQSSLAEAELLYADLRGYYLSHAGKRGERWDRKLLELLERKRRATSTGEMSGAPRMSGGVR